MKKGSELHVYFVLVTYSVSYAPIKTAGGRLPFLGEVVCISLQIFLIFPEKLEDRAGLAGVPAPIIVVIQDL